MFKAEEVIFVATEACNFACEHCFVPKTPRKLDIDLACAFLEDCAKDGVMYVGFSGGEPFLAQDFLCALIKKAVQNDMLFDRLMTNASWWQTEADCATSLERIFNAGFDGKLGISFDAYHGQSAQKIASFLKIVSNIFGDLQNCELVAVTHPFDKAINAKTAKMHKALFALIDEKLDIVNISYVPDDCKDERFWRAKTWFAEDFCAGPGNVYYVHANADVAACCGYANECAPLIIGNIAQNSYAQIVQNAKESLQNGFLRTVYTTGLRATAEQMSKNGAKFPGTGKTSDNCLFCRYLLTKHK